MADIVALAEKVKVICRNGPILAVAITVLWVAIGSDLYPGNEWGVFFLFLFGLPLLLLAYALAILVPWAMRRPTVFKFPSRTAILVAVVVLCVGVILYAFSVPTRVAFWFAQPDFTDAQNVSDINSLKDRRIGIWTVQEAEVDERGGMFIVTSTGADMIDKVSSGFAYQPNLQGTPFGAAQYSLTQLSGDWYRFYVTDDWY